MNCRSAEGLFSSFVEEELSQKERRSLESHLTDCSRCTSAVEELRTTIQLVASLPVVETSADFEEAIMDRVRSGEALRPTVIEWLSEWLAPARLKPVFLAGAAGCAVWIAFLMVQPSLRPASEMARGIATPPAQEVASVPSGNTAGVPAASPSTATSLPVGSERVASAPRTAPASDGSAASRKATMAQAPRASSNPDSAAAPSSPYQDEYILDQFYLNHSSEDGVHSIVPVTGRPSDDVYIVF